MSFHHSLLAVAYPFFRIKNVLRNILTGKKNQLRVLLYHDIPPDKKKQFSDQLQKLKKRWRFISPEEFEKIIDGKTPLKGRNLLLTFDDGFISNKIVADEILLPLDIKAVFFVVAQFVEITNPAEARQYVSDHIFPSLAVDQVPFHWTNMNWSDIHDLVAQGHTIGAHTMTHVRLSTITDKIEIETEVSESADILQQKLGIPIRHFAFPFGNIQSFSIPALTVAQRRFSFVYSGLRGDNKGTVSPYAIRRDSVTADDSDSLVGAFLEGAADFQYCKSNELLDSWISP